MLESIARDEDNSVVVINGKTLENTQYLAKILQEKAGGNIFCIEPHQPYPRDYRPLGKQAKEEQRKNFRPALAGQTANMSEYDTVFIGYPNWWGRHTDDRTHSLKPTISPARPSSRPTHTVEANFPILSARSMGCSPMPGS